MSCVNIFLEIVLYPTGIACLIMLIMPTHLVYLRIDSIAFEVIKHVIMIIKPTWLVLGVEVNFNWTKFFSVFVVYFVVNWCEYRGRGLLSLFFVSFRYTSYIWRVIKFYLQWQTNLCRCSSADELNGIELAGWLELYTAVSIIMMIRWPICAVATVNHRMDHI